MTVPADPPASRVVARLDLPAWERAVYSGPAPMALRAAGVLAAQAGIVVRGSTIDCPDCVTWIGTPEQFAATALFGKTKFPARVGRVRAAWGLEGWARTVPGIIVLTVSAFHEPRSTRAFAPQLKEARADAAFQAHLRALTRRVDDREE